MKRRAAVWLAAAPLTLGPAVGAWAATPTTPSSTSEVDARTTTATSPQTSTDTTTPAPPGDSEATAAGVAGVAAVGHTKAHAGDGSASSTANSVEVGDKPLVPDKTGGSTSGTNSAHGALLDTGTTPLGSLALTPWSASSMSGSTSSSATSDAALARLVVVDPSVATLVLLASHSDASWTSSGSTGSSSSDGAVLDLGGGALTVNLLHSEAKSGSTGSSYLVGINGNEIGSSDQANGACSIDIPSLLSLTCLNASGGAAKTTSAASVANADLANGQLPSGVVSGVRSTGSSAAANPGASENSGASEPAAKSNSPSSAGLPFTGAETGLIVLLGLALIGAGAAILRVVRGSKMTVWGDSLS